jgi:hypothetical protein
VIIEEVRKRIAEYFSCLPAFLIFKPWNEELLMRKAGKQECSAHLRPSASI